MPSLTPYTLPSHKAGLTSQYLSKSMPSPTLKSEMKNENTTKSIVHIYPAG